MRLLRRNVEKNEVTYENTVIISMVAVCCSVMLCSIYSSDTVESYYILKLIFTAITVV